MKKVLIILFVFLYGFEFSYSQDITLKDRIKAEHIFNFGIYINWKEKKGLSESDKFQIGVYGQDTLMYNLLKKICKFRLLKWKQIEILHFTKISEIKNVPILYVNYDSHEEVPKIDSVISKWSTLLVTDSCSNFKGVMINFFPRNALKKVEINKANISARGMKVRSMLYVVAKNYEADWEKLYQKSEVELEVEKDLNEKQQQILINQEKEIKEKKEHIADLFKEIKAKEAVLISHQQKLTTLENDIVEKNKLASIATARLIRQQIEILKQQKDIKETQQLLKKQIAEYELQKSKIDSQKNEINSQQGLIDSQKSKLNKSIADLKKQQLVLYFVLIVLLLIGLMSIVILRNYRIKKRANKALQLKNDEISRQNTEIIQQKEEIETQRDEIEAQRDSLASQRDQILLQNKDITDSITYASRIQEALLPPEMLTSQLFVDHFVMHKPRDIVSGDFYWSRKKNNLVYVAVADCTGHGVPGAFMSMLGVAFLNEIIDKHQVLSAHSLLDYLRDKIIYSLHQTGKAGTSKDGMDISLIVFNETTHEANIAGANNPVYHIRDGVLNDFKPDKMPIGFYHGEEKPFHSQTVIVEKNDVFYMFSDGYADQFGGKDGKKLKYNAFKKLCTSSYTMPCVEQEKFFSQTFDTWKSNYKQVDDVLLLGIRFV
jgi:serine phosphatase RsbU (regulator of sigma subunit)